MLTAMAEPDSVPDDVPLADAVEQARPPIDPDFFMRDESLPEDDRSIPLEADAADWQEQHTTVQDAGEDDFR